MPQLHKSSWVVATLTLVACALIVVPGQITESYLAPFPKFSHGWPLEFLERAVDDSPRFEKDGLVYIYVVSWATLDPPPSPPWLSWDSWRFWRAEETTWKPLHLIFDIGVALAIVAAVTGAWEYRRRRRGNAFQLRLSEFFVATAVLAGVLFWWQSHVLTRNREQQAIEFLTNVNGSVYAGEYESEVNHAPRWLQRLVGPSYLLDPFIRFHRVVIYNLGDLDSQQLEAIVSCLSHFKSLQTVEVFVDESSPQEFLETAAQLRAAIHATLPHVSFKE